MRYFEHYLLWVLKLTFTLGTAFVLTSCQPADLPSKSLRERLEAGEVVRFESIGDRRAACRENRPDWTSVSIGRRNDDEPFNLRIQREERTRQLIIRGQQSTLVHPGHFSCYRVGSEIQLDAFRNDLDAPGRVRILSLSLVHKNFMTSRLFASPTFSTFDLRRSDDFKAAMNLFTSWLEPNHFDIFTLVEVEYISGSAEDEATILSQNPPRSGSDRQQMQELKVVDEGESLHTCAVRPDGSPGWSALIAPEAMIDDVASGFLNSWPEIGLRNCFQVGQIAEVKTSLRGPARACVRIQALERLQKKNFEAHLVIADIDFDKEAFVEGWLSQDFQTPNADWMSLSHFRIVPCEDLRQSQGSSALPENQIRRRRR